MTTSLEELVARSVLAPIDRHFALLLGRLSPDEPAEVLLGAALASRAVQRGHVCVDLDTLVASPLTDEPGGDGTPLDLPDGDALRRALSRSPLVATEANEQDPRPLVLGHGNKLYLYRYALYERRLAEGLRARVLRASPAPSPALRAGLDLLFGPPGADGGEQRRAALLAALSRLLVVSGGPGTGKTFTASRILALLQMQARAEGRGFLRILLLAPTGKAAQHLGESVERSLVELPCDADVLSAIPRKAATLHRALGYQPRSPTRYRHGADNPLPADVVLVDEASMIDVALMAKLVTAVPEDARLILLGDKDQLSSVEAGAILGDICGDRASLGYSAELCALARATTGDELPPSPSRPLPGVQDCLVHLTASRRYGKDSDVGRLASAIQRGDLGGVLALFAEKNGSVRLHPLDSARRLEAMLGDTVLEAYGDWRRGSPKDRLERLTRFRILCAHRKGPFGAVAVNAFVERQLESHGHLRLGAEWYEGRPVMITANDYPLQLFNGDVGVIGKSPDGSTLEAYFPAEAGGDMRRLPPARLPTHETVFAMTVHKSQGSQFGRVALVLPEEASPILTRELVYTAVSRAERGVDVFASETVLRAALGRTVERSSGLREALSGHFSADTIPERIA